MTDHIHIKTKHGHATYSNEPSPELHALVEKMSDMAYENADKLILKKNMQLSLNLHKEWFDAHANQGTDGKRDDYRALSPYWIGRLFDIESTGSKDKYIKIICDSYPDNAGRAKLLRFLIANGRITPKPFTHVQLDNGMKPINELARMHKHYLGLEIGKGRTEWGAEPNEECFIIKCGDITFSQNLFQQAKSD